MSSSSADRPPQSRSSGGGGGGNGGGGGPSTTQLEFTSAMTDFKVMFPDIDTEVIEAVLRANNGAVDATIDHLLTMSADNEAEKTLHGSDDGCEAAAAASSMSSRPPQVRPSSERPPAYPPANPPSYQQATRDHDETGASASGGGVTGDLINLGGTGGNDEASALPSKTDVDLLSNDFFDPLEAPPPSSAGSASASASASLPVPSSSPRHAYSHPTRRDEEDAALEQHREDVDRALSIVPTQRMLQDKYEQNLRQREEARTHPDSAAMSQMLEDERIALMLQNEEFMAELRGDREFMSALQQDHEELYGYGGGGGASSVDGAAAAAIGGGGAPGGGRLQDYSAAARAKNMMMDEAMFREKLKTMGKSSKRKFSQLAGMFSRRKGAAKEMLGRAPAPSNDNLLLNAEPILAEDELARDEENDSEEEADGKKKTPTKGKYSAFS